MLDLPSNTALPFLSNSIVGSAASGARSDEVEIVLLKWGQLELSRRRGEELGAHVDEVGAEGNCCGLSRN